MRINPDPTVDYARHPGRVNFERIRESGNIDMLMNYLEAFRSRGHNPEDPRDEMYAIMGITPEYFDFIKHEMETKPAPKAPEKPTPPSSQPGPSAQQHHGGKSRTQRLGFGPEEDM